MVSRNYVNLDAGGTYKIGNTRVSLDSIVHCYLNGDSPEAIHEAYPAVSLEEVYGTITFYLANQEEVDEYLRKQDERWEDFKAEIDAKPVPPVVARIRALKAAKQGQP